jgi:osmotically-inducible protein OsmY
MHSLHGICWRDLAAMTNPAISVKAENGVIWLWGQVASEPERAAIEAMAQTIPGCRGVANQLNVVASMPYDEQVGI